MASFVLIRHKVRDFAEWKRGYDAYLPKLNEAGLTEKHLLRNAIDENEVVILLEATDLSRAKAFQPVRAAVTGSNVSPPLPESLEVLGRDRTLERLRRVATPPD